MGKGKGNFSQQMKQIKTMTNDGHVVSLSNHKGKVLSGLMNQAPTTDSSDLQTDTVGVAFMRPDALDESSNYIPRRGVKRACPLPKSKLLWI
jgi:hypothetical protein